MLFSLFNNPPLSPSPSQYLRLKYRQLMDN
jgi:hypothetical protein